MSDFSIQEITAETKLTQHLKVMDQINTIERLKTKLKYNVKNRDQICNLPFNLLYVYFLTSSL